MKNKKKGTPSTIDETISNFSSTAKLTDTKGSPQKNDIEYNPFAHRNLEHAYSDMGALAHLLKGSLGSGILAMPNAFRNSGLVFGFVATLIVGLICTHTVQMLVRCSQLLCRRLKVPVLGFAETAEAAFQTGPQQFKRYSTFARNFVNCSILATYYSANCVYVVFIAESIQQVCKHYFEGIQHWDIRIYMLLLTPILVGLSLIRRLKYLVPFSTVANLAIAVSFTITLYYMFYRIPSIHERQYFTTMAQLPLFFSTVIFAMEGIGVVMPVENSMKKPEHFLGCPGVLNISMIVVVALYAIIGFLGYLKYGDDTLGSVTLNLPVDEVLAQIVKILIAMAMIFTYGLQIFIPNDIVLGFIMPRISPSIGETVQYSYRAGIVAVTVGIAAAVPKLGPIISLVGSIFVSTLGLFCPAIIETVVLWDGGLGKMRWRLYKNILIAMFSLFGLITGSYTSVLEIIDTYSSPTE